MYVTSRFILAKETKNRLKSRPHRFGFGLFGETTFYRSYSRIKENGENENWADVVIRVTEGIFSIKKDYMTKHNLPWDENLAQRYAKDFATSFFDMKWMPPGRGLWMMGTEYVYKRGSAALYNCAAVDTSDLANSANWAMDMLMLGAGVGFNTAWDGKASYPDKSHPKTYVIEDSKEGWITSVKLLIESYTKGGPYYRFDYSKIRPAGTPLKTFGGVAAGPKPLKKLHKAIEKTFERYLKKEIDKTRAVVDIFNYIGVCVVSGNIRRSAEIAIGEPTDKTFLNLKNYKLYPDRAKIGWISNNSVMLKSLDDFKYIDSLVDNIYKNGEPGILYLKNIQRYGRFCEEIEDGAWLSNPCGEIALESYELCNLSEIFISKCQSLEEFLKMCDFATFYASTVNLLPTHRPETNRVIARNRRVGVSISGIADFIEKNSIDTLINWMRQGYNKVREKNRELAKECGIPESIKVTAVKPSGTISILAGTSPGMHYPIYRYAVRRIRISKKSPLAQRLKSLPHQEDIFDKETLVFEFPIKYDNPKSIEDISIFEQMTLLLTLQREWSDNMVSNTIEFDKKKITPKDLAKIIKYFLPQLKSTTLLPKNEHIFPQMPFEKIDKDEYESRVKETEKISLEKIFGHHGQNEIFCGSRSCQL